MHPHPAVYVCIGLLASGAARTPLGGGPVVPERHPPAGSGHPCSEPPGAGGAVGQCGGGDGRELLQYGQAGGGCWQCRKRAKLHAAVILLGNWFAGKATGQSMQQEHGYIDPGVGHDIDPGVGALHQITVPGYVFYLVLWSNEAR